MRETVPQGAITELHKQGPQPAPHMPLPVFSSLGSLSCSECTENGRARAPQSPHRLLCMEYTGLPVCWSLRAGWTGSGDGGKPAQSRHWEMAVKTMCSAAAIPREELWNVAQSHPPFIQGACEVDSTQLGTQKARNNRSHPQSQGPRKKLRWFRTLKPVGSPNSGMERLISAFLRVHESWSSLWMGKPPSPCREHRPPKFSIQVVRLGMKKGGDLTLQ